MRQSARSAPARVQTWALPPLRAVQRPDPIEIIACHLQDALERIAILEAKLAEAAPPPPSTAEIEQRRWDDYEADVRSAAPSMKHASTSAPSRDTIGHVEIGSNDLAAIVAEGRRLERLCAALATMVIEAQDRIDELEAAIEKRSASLDLPQHIRQPKAKACMEKPKRLPLRKRDPDFAARWDRLNLLR